ncbi:hypothetical protein [Salipiger abyssi]|uniref:hypothetical protein n=1 Tax=Salipiger abyssi TaxID=1250539 RepID=UPI001A8D1F75|nr:hypothetical protein [Salipiger abyssi]MBN9887765.1 hypothetical protein [Salipiger abyssi]
MTRLFLCLLALPSVAPADCPTAADLDTGILFHLAGGDTELFRREDAQTVRSVYHYAEENAESHVLLGRGMYVLAYGETQDGQPVPEGLMHYDFGRTPAEMPLPEPESGWTADVEVTATWGSEHEVQIYSFGPLSRVSFGDCSYDMIPVIQSYRPDPLGTVEFVNWLPELGISYLSRIADREGEDRYDYTGIEAVH